MSKGKTYKPGQVVWVPNVPDRSGNAKPQPRPLLVIEPAPANRQSQLCCLAISTNPTEDPADPAIEMPWDAKDGGSTGLFEWCRVVLLWFVPVDQANVERQSGAVDLAFLARVMEERQRALDFGSPR